MPKIILPPDAFDDMPDGWCYNTEPDDGDREEHQFPEWNDYADRVAMDLRYEREERFAAMLNDAERIGGAA